MSEKRTPNPLPELSDQDAELLSAYIDDMLSPVERAELESRLEEEAFLREELVAMQQTVAWVNQLPALKAPRNFTITADDVQIRTVKETPKKVLRPNFGWTLAGTAAAVVILFVGFAFVFMQSGSNMTSNAPMEAGNVAFSGTSAAPASEGDTIASSDLEQRAAAPTSTPAPTQAVTSTTLRMGVAATVAAPIVIEIPTDMAQDEAQAVEQEAPQVEISESDLADTDAGQAVAAQAMAASADNKSSTQQMVMAQSVGQETQVAQEAVKLGDVQQTATALTSLFASTPTMEVFSGSDGTTALDVGNQTASPMPEGLALGGAAQTGENAADDSTVESAAEAQTRTETTDMFAEATEEAPIVNIVSNTLPNISSNPSLISLGKILLVLLIQAIRDFIQ